MYLSIHIYFLNDIKNYIKRNNKEIYFSSDFIFRIINKFLKLTVTCIQFLYHSDCNASLFICAYSFSSSFNFFI